MSVTTANGTGSVPGKSAVSIRLFGWLMLGVLAGFLINNVLEVGYGFPGTTSVFSTDGMIPGGIYLLSLAAAVLFVLRTPSRSLRTDASATHKFNCYIIRAAFWAVLLVGLADVTISALRVESLLGSGDLSRNLTRASWVAPNIHLPLVALGMVIALFTRTLGFHWLALLIVVAELGIVISRFVFSYEQALMADLVRYWYAALFLFASAYTLFEDGHVRVDVLYAGFGQTTKGFFNAWGSILLGMTTAWVVLWIGLGGRQSIINSPVMNFEVTQSGSTGMFVKYQMAAFLAIFAITMLIQFVSYFFESVADYREEPGRREIIPASAH